VAGLLTNTTLALRKRQRSLRAAGLCRNRLRRASSTGHNVLTDEALGLAPPLGEGPLGEESLGGDLRVSLALAAEGDPGYGAGGRAYGGGELAVGRALPMEDGAGVCPGPG